MPGGFPHSVKPALGGWEWASTPSSPSCSASWPYLVRFCFRFHFLFFCDLFFKAETVSFHSEKAKNKRRTPTASLRSTSAEFILWLNVCFEAFEFKKGWFLFYLFLLNPLCICLVREIKCLNAAGDERVYLQKVNGRKEKTKVRNKAGRNLVQTNK